MLLIFTADALDVTSEPDEANLAIASANSLTQAHNPTSKFAQLEVELGGSVTLQCPQGELKGYNIEVGGFLEYIY